MKVIDERVARRGGAGSEVMPDGRILIVDDEYGVRSGIRTILEMEGYDVREADCGEAALLCLDTSPWTWCCWTTACPTWTASPCWGASRSAASRPWCA